MKSLLWQSSISCLHHRRISIMFTLTKEIALTTCNRRQSKRLQHGGLFKKEPAVKLNRMISQCTHWQLSFPSAQEKLRESQIRLLTILEFIDSRAYIDRSAGMKSTL